MLNNLAVSAGGLSLGGELFQERGGGEEKGGKFSSSLQIPTNCLGLRGDDCVSVLSLALSLSLSLPLSLGASLLIGELRD